MWVLVLSVPRLITKRRKSKTELDIMALINQRIDVPVIVDESKCLEKCTACIEVCPLDVLAKNPETGKAYMKYDECWFCLPCEKECPTNAITVQIPFLLR